MRVLLRVVLQVQVVLQVEAAVEVVLEMEVALEVEAALEVVLADRFRTPIVGQFPMLSERYPFRVFLLWCR